MGIVLPRALTKALDSGSLTHRDAGVYVEIARRASANDGVLTRTVNQLATDMSLSKTTIIQTVRRLSDHGLLLYRPALSKHAGSELVIPKLPAQAYHRCSESTSKLPKAWYSYGVDGEYAGQDTHRSSSCTSSPDSIGTGEYQYNGGQPCVEVVDEPVDTAGQEGHRSLSCTSRTESKVSPIRSRSSRPKDLETLLSEEAARLAELLLTKMRSVDPKAKGSLDRWAEEIERLHRIDGRDWEQIERVIQWLYCTDNDAVFWRPNIHSGHALRKHFTKLVLKMGTRRAPKRDTRPKCPECDGKGFVIVDHGETASVLDCPNKCDNGRLSA